MIAIRARSSYELVRLAKCVVAWPLRAVCPAPFLRASHGCNSGYASFAMTENASRSRGARLLVQQCLVCVMMMMVDCVDVVSEDCRQQLVVHASLACINSTVTCVELLGPRDVHARSSIPVILASPHGGTQRSDGYVHSIGHFVVLKPAAVGGCELV